MERGGATRRARRTGRQVNVCASPCARAMEDDLARLANRVVIADVDPLASDSRHRRFIGSYARTEDEIAGTGAYDCCLVLPIGLPIREGWHSSCMVCSSTHSTRSDADIRPSADHPMRGSPPPSRRSTAEPMECPPLTWGWSAGLADHSGAMTTVHAMALFPAVPDVAMAPGHVPAPTGPV